MSALRYPRSLLLGALLLATPAARAIGQAGSGAAHCQTKEGWQECYDRTTKSALDAVRAARARHDTLREGRLLRGMIPAMASICRGGKLGPACYFAGRLTLATAINDAAAQRQSVELYATGCLAPNPSAAACNGLGDAFGYGLGRAANPDSALYYFHRGCVNGNATACSRAASRYVQAPELGPAAVDSSRKLARLGCSGGSVIGCAMVAQGLFQVLDSLTPATYGRRRYEQLRDSAMGLDSLACWSGSRVGCNRLALDFTRRLGRTNIDSARFYYDVACADSTPLSRPSSPRDVPLMKGRQQQGIACDNLADLLIANPTSLQRYRLASGRSIVPPDRQAALAYYRLGCAALEPNACVDLARADSSLSDTEHLFLFATACLNGSGYGCDNAGLQLSSRFVDSASAARYLRLSCDFGDTNGCNNLGVLKERLDSQNLALKYYREACDADNSNGCYNLGLRLEFGYHSPDLALGYYARACTLKDLTACRRAVAGYGKLGQYDAEARYRTLTCELFAAECKRKN